MPQHLDNFIHIYNATQNNLKGINVSLPINKLIVVTGVSGAGKSSFAYDVLYAEGQRRYVETFSPYARQFIERMDKPNVEKIEGILPAIAIDQKHPVKTSRSTVGTMTEINDYLKLLFAHLATLYCPQCGKEVKAYDIQEIINEIQQRYRGEKLFICFPYQVARPKEDRFFLLKHGFDRILKDGKILNLDELNWHQERCIYVFIDRLNTSQNERLHEALQMAYQFGQGKAAIYIWQSSELKLFSRDYMCPYCNKVYQRPHANLFSFNSPLGACPTCRGFGKIIGYDMDLVIPDKNMSLAEGAIKIWKKYSEEYEDLMRFCQNQGIPVDVPFTQLSSQHQAMIINGGPGFYGIKGFFDWLETKSYKMHVRVFLSRYRGYFTCPDCQGTRFKREVLQYKLKGRDIAQILSLSIDEAYDFFTAEFLEIENPAVNLLLNEIKRRLFYLKEAGVGYLTLDRQSRTLSGGEVARVNLTKALGSALVNTLFILDEPSVGLHPRDNERLINILKRLAQENTVVVVEHDPDILKAAEYVLELGPGAGERGGQIVFWGTIEEFKKQDTLTAQYLTGKKQIKMPNLRRRPKGWIEIQGAKANNLKGIDVRIPLGVMVCLTGVSGSGKSTLAQEIIYKGIKKEKGDFCGKPGIYKRISGFEKVGDIILVDQSPIGQTPRANPATYLDIFTSIRKFFASLPEAKTKGLNPGHFSFNSPGGRCPACQGAGYERIEMQFLSDVYITCPVCKGKRYQEDILEITFKGKNIADVLNMTFQEARHFFSFQPQIVRQLLPAIKVGLGYLRLGQPINTLSGGEAGRLKLAKFLRENGKKGILFIFDEPTVGLHPHDIQCLLNVFQTLLTKGHSLLIIEHNLEVIKWADYLIDLGPEGGDRGGEIIAAGTPEEIINHPQSYTGQCLKKYNNFFKQTYFNPF